jgi:ribosomal protein S18 acetylase RimI-like enzyme
VEPLAEIAGARVRAVLARLADVRALQEVMDAARDYFELTEGAPAGPGAAAALIAETEADSERRVFLLWTVPSSARPERRPRAAGPESKGETEPIGFLDLHLHQPEPGVAHAGVLALRPEARGRGLGAELVEALCAALRAEGFGALRASVGDENPTARAFWERVGLGEVGRLDGGVCVMERVIG